MSKEKEAFLAGYYIASQNWYCSEVGNPADCIDLGEDNGFSMWKSGEIEIRDGWAFLKNEVLSKSAV